MPSSLFALLDDIATGLDDVALLTKVAARKTAGVLGDDLTLNAQQVAGVSANRELPVVWAVAKGSAINKAILVPAALVISALAPWAVTPLLMIGGAFLCYEGVEKIAHKLLHSKGEDAAHEAELMHALIDPAADLLAIEKDKIRGAVRTDFILSAEIIVITLGTVANSTFVTQVLVLTCIAVIMTVGVYGLVGGIVKLDDGGMHLSQRSGRNGVCPDATRPGRRHSYGRALADEGAVRGRHRGHVPCGRRHTRPRHSAAAPCFRAARRRPGGVARSRRYAPVADARCTRRGHRHHRGRAGARHSDRRPARAARALVACVRVAVAGNSETSLLGIRTEGEEPAVAVLHDEFARVPRRVGKASRELNTSCGILDVERVRILDEQVGVEELVGVFVWAWRRRFGAAEVDSVLIARHDGVDRWILPGAETFEAKRVPVVGEGRRHVRGEELGRDLADHVAQHTIEGRPQLCRCLIARAVVALNTSLTLDLIAASNLDFKDPRARTPRSRATGSSWSSARVRCSPPSALQSASVPRSPLRD